MSLRVYCEGCEINYENSGCSFCLRPNRQYPEGRDEKQCLQELIAALGLEDKKNMTWQFAVLKVELLRLAARKVEKYLDFFQSMAESDE